MSSPLGFSLAHGYQIWRALIVAVLLVGIGAATFRAAHEDGQFERAKSGDAPAFSAWGYSFDTLVPVINLHQEEYQLPTGAWTWYLWFHIIAGWVLTSLIALGVTGLVRRE